METLFPYEYDIPVVRGGHLEGPHVFGFLIHVFPSKIWSQTCGASMHGEINKNVCFNNLKWTIVKICKIPQFNRATPGSSLVHHKFVAAYGFFISVAKTVRIQVGISFNPFSSQVHRYMFQGLCLETHLHPSFVYQNSVLSSSDSGL